MYVEILLIKIGAWILFLHKFKGAKTDTKAGRLRDRKTWKHTHTYTQMKTRNKGCVLQLQPAQIPDTVFPLHRAARIRALVCSSPCLLMLTLGFFAA